MIDDLRLFIAIVQAGSLTAAAKQQHIPPATLTRHLQQLENQLGDKLLHRSARGIKLTQAGEIYYERCLPLLNALDQTVQEIRYNHNTPAGRICILAPINLGAYWLSEFWIKFLQEFPEIQLDLRLDNRNENLIKQGADLAIRTGTQHDPSYKQRFLGQVHFIIVASPQYLSTHTINTPEDLSVQYWSVMTPVDHFDLKKDGQEIHISLKNSTQHQMNEAKLCLDFAIAGLGLAYLPNYLCAKALANGQLHHLLPDWQTSMRDIYAVWPNQKKLPARVRVLLDRLLDFIQHSKI